TDLFTRAPASSTLRLKSIMDSMWEPKHVRFCVADTRLAHYFLLQDEGQARRIQTATVRGSRTQVSAGRFAVESRHGAQTLDNSGVVIDAVVGGLHHLGRTQASRLDRSHGRRIPGTSFLGASEEQEVDGTGAAPGRYVCSSYPGEKFRARGRARTLEATRRPRVLAGRLQRTTEWQHLCGCLHPYPSRETGGAASAQHTHAGHDCLATFGARLVRNRSFRGS